MNEEPIVIEANKRNTPPKSHKLVIKNGTVMCISCENRHTVNVDPGLLADKGYLVIESN